MSCPDCFRGAVHSRVEPAGTFELIHGLRTYVASGGDPSKSKSTIIYLPDAYSLKLVNNKILADNYARLTGCRVLIPDITFNGGLNPALLPKMEILLSPLKAYTFNDILQKLIVIVTTLPLVLPFALLGHPQRIYPRLLDYARNIKADLPPGGRLGVNGFCWGGWPSTKLCTEASMEGGSGRLIDAQFVGHPSYMISTPEMFVDAITKFKVPFSVAVACEDWELNTAAAANVEAKIRQTIETGDGGVADYQYEFELYEGCRHGFCIRAKEDEANMKGYDAALHQAVNWFNKHLN